MSEAEVAAIDREIAERLTNTRSEPRLQSGSLTLAIRTTEYRAAGVLGATDERLVHVVAFADDGGSEAVTVAFGNPESRSFWITLLRGLVDRGVEDVKLVVSEALPGLEAAVASVYPMARFRSV